MKDSSPFLPGVDTLVFTSFFFRTHARFRLLFPILLFASGSPCDMEKTLYYDPYIGRLRLMQEEPYQNFSENSKGDTMWIDQSNDKVLNPFNQNFRSDFPR